MAVSAFQKISYFLLSGKAAAYPLSSVDIAVLQALAAFMQMNASTFVSQERLSQYTRLSERSLRQSLAKLKTLQLISSKRQGKRNCYYLLID